MNGLYNRSLFHTTIQITNISCKVIAQIFIVFEGVEYRLGLAKSGDIKQYNELDIYFLFQIEKEYGFIPIDCNNLNEILSLLNKIPLKNEIRSIISSIPKDKEYKVEKLQTIELTNRFFCNINNITTEFPNSDTSLIIFEEYKLCPKLMSFFCYDDLRFNLYAEINEYEQVEISKWHILSGLKLYVNEEFEGEYYPEKVWFNDQIVCISAQTMESAILSSSNVSELKYSGATPYQLIDFMMSIAGLNDRVSYPKGYEKNFMWYTVIIPVRRLEINSEFGVGCVRFINGENLNQSIIDFSEGDFTTYKTFAIVHVNEHRIYNAYQKGSGQIQRSLDFLMNISRDDSLFSNHSYCKQPINRSIQYYDTRVELSDWVYIEAPSTSEKLICNYADYNSPSALSISDDIIKSLNDSQKAELLMIKISNKKDKRITPLFDSLKWVRKAWDSTDTDDQIINAIIALEFIVAGEKGVPLLENGKLELILNDFESSIREHYSICEETSELVNKSKEKLKNSFSETPFMIKLSSLIERLKIPISKHEMQLIVKARKKRNLIMHGKESAILSNQEIKQLCETVSVIAFYKMNEVDIDI